MPSPATDPSSLSAQETIERWIAGHGIGARPLSTMQNYRRAMDAWLAFLRLQSPPLPGSALRDDAVWRATQGTVAAWQTELKRSGKKASTINHMLASVSSFYKYASDMQLTPAGFAGSPLRAHHVREAVAPYANIRVLTQREYAQLIAWMETHTDSVYTLRAHALIRTLLHTGWRGRELLAMRKGDLQRAPTVPGAMHYHYVGSGRDFNDLLPADCVTAMQAYLEKAGRPLFTLTPDAYLWTPVKQTNLSGIGATMHMETPIDIKTALGILRSQLRRAGIAGSGSFRLEDLRHTHAYLMYEEGATEEAISKRMHHTHRRSTSRYLRSMYGQSGDDIQTPLFEAIRRRNKVAGAGAARRKSDL